MNTAQRDGIGKGEGMDAPLAVLVLLERFINTVLGLDREALSALAALEGRIIRVCLGEGEDSALVCYLVPSATGVRLNADSAVPADVTVRGGLRAFMQLLVPGGFTSAQLEVEGDAELGRRLQRILHGLDIDWEEQAARVLGDVPAHLLGRAVRSMIGWQREARAALAADLSEYLQEEITLLASAARTQAFLDAVDDLRMDTDRLEARIRRLQERYPC